MLVWTFDAKFIWKSSMVSNWFNWGTCNGFVSAFHNRHILCPNDLLKSLSAEELYIPPISPYPNWNENAKFYDPIAHFLFPHEKAAVSLEYDLASGICRVHDVYNTKKGINKPLVVLKNETPLSAIRFGNKLFLLTRKLHQGFLYCFQTDLDGSMNKEVMLVSGVLQTIVSVEHDHQGMFLTFLSSDAAGGSPRISKLSRPDTSVCKIPFTYKERIKYLWDDKGIRDIDHELLKKGKTPAEFNKLINTVKQPFDKSHDERLYPHMNYCHDMVMMDIGDDDCVGTMAFKSNEIVNQSAFEKVYHAAKDSIYGQKCEIMLEHVTDLGKKARLIHVDI